MTVATTVRHKSENASSAKAKKSGFWRGLFSPSSDDEQGVEPFLPDEPTAEVLREARKLSTPQPPVTPKPQVLYRERPNDIDRAGYNIMGVLSLAGRDKWGAGRVLDGIEEHLAVLRRIKADEDAEGQKLLARSSAAAAAPTTALNGIRSVVTAAQKANDLPGVTVTAVIDTGAIASELTAVTANAHAPADETLTFQAITPDMPDPRVKVMFETDAAEPAPRSAIESVTVPQPASPVHVPGEDLRPPIPATDGGADHGVRSLAEHPLPMRVPHVTVIRAPVGPDGSPLHGHKVDPAAAADFGSGDWVFRGASDADSAPVYRQVASVEVGDSTLITYRNGDTQPVRRGNEVRVLSDAEARDLLAAHQAQANGNGQVAS